MRGTCGPAAVARSPCSIYIGHVDSHDVTGLTGRVVTPIGTEDPGEVVIAVGSGSETFTATSADGAAIPKHTRVVVEEHFPPRHVVVLPY
jgi:hypothetical protein